MTTEQKIFLEYWHEDFSTRNIDPIPASQMPEVRESITEDVNRLVWVTEWFIDDLERKLHRLEPDDPLWRQATSAIAAERNARANEGPTARTGRQAMLDIYRLSTVELAVQLNDIRAKLAALPPDSPVRVAGERALAGRERLLQQMQDRISVGDSPWTEPTPGEPLKVGDGFELKGDSERLHYAITAASPGRDGKPNHLLAAFAQMAADPEPAPPTAGGDDEQDERDPDD